VERVEVRCKDVKGRWSKPGALALIWVIADKRPANRVTCIYEIANRVTSCIFRQVCQEEQACELTWSAGRCQMPWRNRAR